MMRHGYIYRKLGDLEKDLIVRMFRETESATLTAAVWGIEPAEVVGLAFFADHPGRKPPARAQGVGRGNVVEMKRRMA